MIVMKFGGTSTQDAEAISNVVGIIRKHQDRKPVVVISAIAQATNMLEKAGSLAAAGKAGEAHDALLSLFERHYTIVDRLMKDRQRHAELRKIIAQSLSEVEELIRGISILHELTPRTLDSLYSYGELLSSRMVAGALQEMGVASEWIDSKEFMLTDDTYNAASPLMPAIEERLPGIVSPLCAAGGVPVTQGFIGVTSSGFRTTMGRESSDFSASIIGCALHADDIQIWTDVDGVLTADPRIVDGPRKIRALSFEEAYELSYFGAKVLHPKTMLPAVEMNIPIHIYNSRRPDRSGTHVSSSMVSSEPMVKSVAYKRNLVVVTVAPKRRIHQYVLWEHIQSVLTRYNVSASLTVTSEYSYAFVLDETNPVDSIVAGLGDVGSVSVFPGKAIICLVGSRMRESTNILGRLFHSLAGYKVELISYGASPSNISLVVDDAAVPELVRKVHAEFFDAETHEDLFEKLEIESDPLSVS
ncbi:MAG TPA: aspartate kinase [Bacteroidota bacterium]|nr:aspartate kinase [Bacteroidota bacterium]